MNVLIVDDEKKACRNLSSMLLEYVDPAISIVGFAHCVADAELYLKDHKIDAVFLDIEMPGENIFHFLDRLFPFNFEVIFVTAYDEYAIRAFKLSAIDYILKPLSIDDLRSAVKKLNERLGYKQMLADKQLLNDLSDRLTGRGKSQKLTLRDGVNIEIVDFNEILFVEAMGSYSKIYFEKNKVEKNCVASYAISVYEDILPSDIFFRIHKSYMVNIEQFERLHKEDHVLIMKNGLKLPVSRRRYSELMLFLTTKKRRNG